MEKEVMIGGRLYNTIQIGSQLWTVENLRSESHSKGSSWDNGIYGRLYDWDAAMTLSLPDGWRLPSKNDWEKINEIPDEFNLTYGGRCKRCGGKMDVKPMGFWWTSDLKDSIYSMCMYVGFSPAMPDNFKNAYADKFERLSVRCVCDLPKEESETTPAITSIDWEERRCEIAKAAMCSMIQNKPLESFSKMDASMCVSIAERLIEELKGDQTR